MRDAEILSCVAELEHCKTIVERGTSADSQLKAAAASANSLEAAKSWIARETLEGLSIGPRSCRHEAHRFFTAGLSELPTSNTVPAGHPK
jgi:carboxylate-amine ligase